MGFYLKIFKNRFFIIFFTFKLIITSFIVINLQSCVLTNSQVKVTKNYYSALDDIDRQCLTIKEAASAVTFQRSLLFPASYSNDSIMVDALIDSYELYKKETSPSDSFSLKVNALGNYFQSYTTLLPRQRNTTQAYDRRVLSAIENFSSYLPFGIGLTIYKTVYDLVSYTTRFITIPHSRKKMKKYIIRGESIVPANSAYIVSELKVITLQLEKEKDLIKQNYLNFLQNQQINKTPADYYQNYNKMFLDKYHLASSSLEMSKYLTVVLPEISNTYSTLFSETQSRKRMKNGLPGLIEMYSKLAKTTKQYSIVTEALKDNK